MRIKLHYNMRFVSVILTILLAFAGFSVCEAAEIGNERVSDYAKPYIEELTESVSFNYDDYMRPIERGEFAELVYFSIKQMSEAMDSKVIINDAKPSFLDTDDVCVGALLNSGIVTGRSDEYFSPKDVLTREEAATVMGRVFDLFGFKKLNKTINFADESDIESWAMSAVDALCPYKIIIGTDSGKFMPKSEITREQAAVIVQRFMRMAEIFEINEPLPEGFHAWQTWSASYIEDHSGKVIFSIPRYYPPEMGESVESYDGMRICKYKESYICVTSGIDASSAAKGNTIPGTVVFDIFTGRELMFVPMKQNDCGNWASGFYDFAADGEHLIFYHQIEQGSAMGSNGKYVYGVYDINGNETVSIAHSWKELYDEGWVSKKSEPF